MPDPPGSTGVGSLDHTRRAFLTMAATGSGLVGVRTANATGREEVPIVWRRDRFGDPETVRYVPRERYRRIRRFHELSPGRVAGRVDGLALVQRSADPTDLALKVYVEESVESAGRPLPESIAGMPVIAEARPSDRTTLGVCRDHATTFYDPLPANVGVEGYEDDDFVGTGTLGLVCWTDGETEGNVDADDGEDDGEPDDDDGDGDDERIDDEGEDDESGGDESEGDDADEADDGGDDSGDEEADPGAGNGEMDEEDGDEDDEDDEDDGGRRDVGDAEDAADEEEDLTECYVTAAHVVSYERDDDEDRGVASHLRHEGRVEGEDTVAREEYVGSYRAHSSLGDEGMDVALYTRREDTVEADPLANADPQLGDVVGTWTHAGLTDRTLEEALPVAYAGQSTCYATMECVEATKGSLVEYEARYSPIEVSKGDSGGPLLDRDGYLVGIAVYTSESEDVVAGPTGQELLDRLGARLAGPDEDGE